MKIFNFLKSEAKSELETDAMEVVSNTYPKEVQEIHNEFMTAGDKLLASANNILSSITLSNQEKANKLNEFGFTSTKEVVSLNEFKKATEEQKNISQVVSDYKILYPNYKFVSEEIAKKICEKYNLVLGEVSQYKGFVPAKNLTQIEQFYNSHPDLKSCYYVSFGFGDRKLITKEHYESYIQLKNDLRGNGIGNSYYCIEGTPKLFICAPIKDMDMKGYKQEGHKLIKEIPDPVVLYPIVHDNGVSGYLIVTAWGDEASDEMVVNNALN
jgi:hypothetical protein